MMVNISKCDEQFDVGGKKRERGKKVKVIQGSNSWRVSWESLAP